MRETIGAALKALGHSINTTDDAQLSSAQALLLRWKAQAAKFDNEGYKAGLDSGEFLLVHGYSGDLWQVAQENDKIEIIVYVDLSDLKQSNIGTEDAFTNATGRTKIFGNKIFVYFNGSHADLRRQIREGIAGVYLESMMLGANLQEYVQNSILFNMPAWFRDGLIAYAGAGWDT